MPYAKTFVVLVALAFVSHLSVLTPAKADEAGRWTVASVSGPAKMRAARADWQPLGADVQVGIGQEIRTGKNGRVVLTRGDESVTISPASSFAPKEARGGMMTRIFQRAGSLLFKVHKQPNRHFEVETPYLVAAVKGTTFTVNVDDAGGAVHVIEGLVEVGSLGGDDRVLVRPGRTASVGSSRGSKVQIGETPKKSPSVKGKGKQSKAPVIEKDMGVATVDIEKSSNGLFKNPKPVSGTQVASTASSKSGNGGPLATGSENAVGNAAGGALGNDNSLAGSLNASFGFGTAGGNGNAGGQTGGAAGGASGAPGAVSGAAGVAGGAAGGIAGGLGSGLGNGVGSGNGNGKGNGKN
jgi:hypothetical protein